MEIQPTAVVKLSVPDDRRDDLKRTMNTFRDAAQRFADRGWEGDDNGYVITTRTQLQPLVYDEIREDTGLHSDLCVGALNQATDALDLRQTVNLYALQLFNTPGVANAGQNVHGIDAIQASTR